MDDAQILEKADEAFDDGRDAMQEMDYVAAKEAFERALSLYRSCPPAAVEKSVRADIHHALGTIELGIGDSIMIKAVSETCGRSVASIKVRLLLLRFSSALTARWGL